MAVERANRLIGYSDFGEIISCMLSAAVESFAWEPFNGPQLRECHRASFLLRVSPEHYDAFFNAPVGYRGQFALSPALGEAANQALLRELEPLLVTRAASSAAVPEATVRASLVGAGAKVWIYEAEVESQLGSGVGAISYSPWEKASVSGVGLLAPVGTLLEVKGGWLSANGGERINPSKAGRSEEIHREGFS